MRKNNGITIKKIGKAIPNRKSRSQTIDAIFDNGPIICFEWQLHPDYRTISVSPNIRQFGYSPEDFIQNPLLLNEITHPDDVKRIFQLNEEALKQGKTSAEYEYRIIDKAGKVRWIHDYTMLTEVKGKKIAKGLLHDITDRVLSDQHRYMDRLKYVDLISSVNGIVWEADANTFKFSFVSDFAVKALGYPLQRWYEEDDFWVNHIYDEDREQAVRFCKISTEAMEDHVFEYRMVASDGSLVWLRDSVRVVTANGRPSILRGVMLDISETKKTESLLKESQELNQFLIEHTSEAILFGTEDGEIFSANEAACKLFRRTEKELKSLGRKGIIDLNDSRLQQFINDRNQNGYSTGELSGLRSDGSKFDISITSTVIKLPNGNRAVTLVVKDITEKIQAERKLRESELKFKALFQSTSDSIILMDKSYKVLDFNRVALSFTKSIYKTELFIGLDMLQFTNDATRQSFMSNVNSAFNGISTSKDLEILYSDGSTHWWQVQYFPVMDNDTVIAVAFNAKDIDAEMRSIQRLTHLTNSIPDSVIFEYWVAADGSNHAFRYMSLGAIKVFETNPDVIVKDVTQAFSLVHPDDQSKVYQAGEYARKNLTSYDVEYRIIVKSGAIKWLHTKSVPKKLLDGSVLFEGISVDITKGKLSEFENSKLSLIAKETSNLVIITDKHRKIEWVNQAFIKTTGYEIHEVLGKTPSELLQGPDTDQEVIKKIREKLNRQQSVRFEILNYTKYKERYWLEVEIQPVFDHNGVLTNFIAIENNITDRKHTELLLKKQAEEIIRTNELLLTISENLPDAGIYQVVADSNHVLRFTYLSERFAQIIGIPAADMMLDINLYFEGYHPEDRNRIFENQKTVIQESAVSSIQFRYKRPDGRIIWLHSRSKPTKEADLLRFDGIMVDITDQKDKEQLLIEQRKQIDEKSRQLQTTAENLPDSAIYQLIIDNQGNRKFTYVSDSVKQLTTLSAEQIIANPTLVYDQIHPEDREKLKEAEEAAFRNLTIYDQEFRVITPGGFFWHHARSVPRQLPDGVVFDGYIHDITARVELTNKFYFTHFTVEHSTDSIFWVMPDGSFFDFNDAACKSLGYTREELASLKVQDIDINYNAEVWPNHWQELKQKRVLTFETKQKRKDGSLLNVEIVANLIEYSNQEYNCAFVRDVSEKMRSHELIKEREHRLKRITENLPHAVIYQFRANTDGTFAIPYIGENILDLTGIPASTIMADPQALMSLIVPEDRDEFNLAVGKSAQQLSDFNDCCRFDFGNGNFKWLRAVAKPERLPDGTILWDGIMTDETIAELDSRHEKNKTVLLEELLNGAPLPQILNTIATSIEAIQTGYKCSILLLNDTGKKLYHGAAPSLPEFYIKAVDGIEIREGVGCCGTTVVTGNLTIASDLLTHPFWANYRDLVREAGLRSCWSYPVKNVQGKVLGTFALYHSLPKEPTAWDIEMIDRYSDLVYLAIDRTKILEELREREQKLERIAQNLPKGSVYQFKVTKDGALSMPYFSDGLAKQLGITGRDVMDDVLAFNSLCHPDDVAIIQRAVFESAENLTDLRLHEGRFRDMEENYHHLGWYSKPYRLADGSTMWEGIVMDETEQHEYQKNIEEREQRFQLAIKIGNLGVYEWDVIHNEIYFDESAREMFYMKDVPSSDILNQWQSRIHPDDLANVQSKMRETLDRGLPHYITYRWISPTNEIKTFEVNAIAKLDASGKTRAIVGVLSDITEKLKAQELLIESESRFSNLVKDVNVGVMMQGPGSEVLMCNQAALLLLGLTEDQLTGRSSFSPEWQVVKEDSTPFPGADHPVPVAIRTKKQVRNVVMGVFRPMSKDWVWLLVDALPRLDVNQNIMHVICTFIDISDLKKTEIGLEKTIREKEVLIKEIHHRVKNNLQLISSMLYFKFLELKDEPSKSFLTETRQKIRSIAMIHEKLLQTESITELDINDYLSKLLAEIQMSIVPTNLKIDFELSIVKTNMHIDKAIYCGLIINELVTNAIKHGFRNTQLGVIRIDFNVYDNKFQLTVENNGELMPDIVRPETAQSFGLKMLNVFTNQLKATAVWQKLPHTKVTITFS